MACVGVCALIRLRVGVLYFYFVRITFISIILLYTDWHFSNLNWIFFVGYKLPVWMLWVKLCILKLDNRKFFSALNINISQWHIYRVSQFIINMNW